MRSSSSAIPTVASARVPLPSLAMANLRLGELVGSGRHGIVLRAHHRLSDSAADMSDVAVKMPVAGESLDHEAETLQRFAHPNVVQLLEGPLSNGALILEYCGRGSLADRCDEPLTADEATTIVRQIGGALTNMHQDGWIHGDVSLHNIAIRHDGTVALIDFATARKANGEPLYEGTAELAGPRRTARAELDLRCLAAAVLSALPDPTVDAFVPADIRNQRQALMSVIKRSDAGEPVALSDLLVGVPTAEVEITTTHRRIASRSSGPQTREFGPRPGGGDSTETERNTRPLGRVGVVAVVIFLALLALTSLLFEQNASLLVERASEQTAAPTLASLDDAITRNITAEVSLLDSGVTWESGVATRQGVSYAVGETGDLAAVGDWDCNGTRTLGVYRPASGSWFTFAGWEPSASSSLRQLDPGRLTLSVAQTASGCEQPMLTG